MKSHQEKIVIAFYSVIMIVIIQSCERPGLPIVTTENVSEITQTTAYSGGNVLNNGGAEVIERGVCWGTSQNPAISTNNKTSDGRGNGSYTSKISGLSANTAYYVRAYATNSAGTSYGNDVPFTTSHVTISDIDGNVYNPIKIGTQIWMKENLNATKYNDGTNIQYITDNNIWLNLTSGAYCDYNNNPSLSFTYGRLYNWYAVNTNKLCPLGWHVPSDAEWTILENFLISNGFNYDGTTSGNKTAKSIAAITLWNTSVSVGAIGNTDYPEYRNKTNFSALPSGSRDPGNGAFYSLGLYCTWWSSTEEDALTAWTRFLYYDWRNVSKSNARKIFGFSVRCVMN